MEKLDLQRMPHAKDIHPNYVVGGGYGIGFFNYITTLLYNPEKIEPPKSWRELWNAKNAGKVIITPATHTQGLLVTVMAARLNGGGADDLDKAWPMLEKLRPQLHSFAENRGLTSELFRT